MKLGIFDHQARAVFNHFCEILSCNMHATFGHWFRENNKDRYSGAWFNLTFSFSKVCLTLLHSLHRGQKYTCTPYTTRGVSESNWTMSIFACLSSWVTWGSLQLTSTKVGLQLKLWVIFLCWPLIKIIRSDYSKNFALLSSQGTEMHLYHSDNVGTISTKGKVLHRSSGISLLIIV